MGCSRPGELARLLSVSVFFFLIEDRFQRVGAEIAVADGLLVFRLDEEGAGEPEQGLVAGEDADDVGAAFR